MGENIEDEIFYVNPPHCLGCRQCELSCAQAHMDTTLAEAVLNSVPIVKRIRVVSVDGMSVPLQCRQCEEAPCLLSCPMRAISRKNGVVSVNESYCVGCKICELVCPFGAIEVGKEKTSQHQEARSVAKKCDRCEEWRLKNNQDECACVLACPTKTLKLLDIAAYRRKLSESRAREIVCSHNALNKE